MSKIVKGALITSDVATIQLLKALNEKDKFIIKEIDKNNVFVNEDMVDKIREEVYNYQEELCKPSKKEDKK